MDLRNRQMIKIDTFHPKHLDGVIDLIVGIQRGEFGLPITAGDQPDLKTIPEYYQTGKGNFWVASIGGRVVGTISILDIGGGNCALRKMFVHRDFRGSGYGVAGKLLATLLDWCASQSIRQIFLGTTPKFLAAHRFYEKNGFVEIPKDELPPPFPVMKVDTKFYKYSVGTA